MSRERVAVSPQVTAGDTIVKAGPIVWRGVKAIRDKILSSGLKPPTLELGAAAISGGVLSLTPEAINALFEKNLSILASWAAAHQELLELLVIHGSNLGHGTEEEIQQRLDGLDAQDVLAIATAVLEASVNAGLYDNYSRFFAGLLAPILRALGGSNQPPSESNTETSETAGASTTSTD